MWSDFCADFAKGFDLIDHTILIQELDKLEVYPLAPEIIQRNSISLLNCAASDIHNFAIAPEMKLNPTKCKETFVNFLRNSNVLLSPIIIGNNIIEQVKCFKIFFVILSNDLKWNIHVDYIVKNCL